MFSEICMSHPEDVKQLADELGKIAQEKGCTTIIALSHPIAGWYIAVPKGSIFEALGLAHQVLKTLEAMLERSKKEVGAKGDI